MEDKSLISKQSINKLAKKAGIKSISSLIPDEIIGVTRVMLEQVLKICILVVKSGDRKTITLEDIKYALENLGHKLYDYDDVVSKCKPFNKGKIKKNRYLREIQFYQNQDDCVYIPKATFKNLVKFVMKDHFNSKLKFNTIAIEQLQVAIEDLLVLLLQNSYVVAIHAQRTTLHPKDVTTARFIMKSCDSIFHSE